MNIKQRLSFIAGLISIFGFFVAFFNGGIEVCLGSSSNNKSKPYKFSIFRESDNYYNDTANLLIDNETKREYIIVRHSHGIAITPRLPAE